MPNSNDISDSSASSREWRIVEASRRLADEFAKQGLHVGMGPPGHAVCVTCGADWPCADSSPDKLDPPCEADR